jgi:16S rRNA (cytosine967-C5)-methyltransferase
LREAGIKFAPGRLMPSAIVANPGQHLSGLALLKKGRAVLQDEASQVVAGLLGDGTNNRVLDLCAAPGLKTSRIASGMGGGLLIACDRSRRRLRTMSRLLPGWIGPKTSVCLVQLDAAVDLPFSGTFDRILLDAPCSGTGTLARNPEIKWRLKAENLEDFATRQRRMLHNALRFLAPGGRLVYATCSLEPEENESVVEDVLESFPGFKLLQKPALVGEFPQLDSALSPSGYFHTRPDLHGCDGFFAAVITRRA